jgi:hypothetical protein
MLQRLNASITKLTKAQFYAWIYLVVYACC